MIDLLRMNNKPIKILFIGEAWSGSCAESLGNALDRVCGVEVFKLDENRFFTKGTNLVRKIYAKIFNWKLKRLFESELLRKLHVINPEIVVCYKGYNIQRKLIDKLRQTGCLVVNIYPDLSPHGHGVRHKNAVGAYDLVISTKIFHPENWQKTYGYSNECIFVPQGYDPELHLSPRQLDRFGPDVALVATYRQEYGVLMLALAEYLKDLKLSVVVGGNGWNAVSDKFPAGWRFVGPVSGQAYVDLLKSSKICIAPLTTTVIILGKSQPGDVDTTRSYELAAANCFFIHRRTEFMRKLYDEKTEVPMFDNAKELAEQVMFYLGNDCLREQMAQAAHDRAVPAYSIDERAKEIVAILRNKVASRNENLKYEH